MFYSDWMKLNKRSTPSNEAFSYSRLFNAFYKFAEHVSRLKIAHPDVFVRAMVEYELSPVLWTRDQSYDIYLKKLDNNTDPLILVKNSVEFLIKMSEAADVPLAQVFELLSANEFADLIIKRELTVWLLFLSKSFIARYEKFDAEDRKMLADIIGPTHWAIKFEKNPKLLDDFRKLAIDIGI
jgi:hypothetical protein